MLWKNHEEEEVLFKGEYEQVAILASLVSHQGNVFELLNLNSNFFWF